jgi:PIN domain nuclease of toxin-antitoxin system
VRLLLDTHVVLWLFDDPRLVSPALIDTLRRRPALVVSVASLWEIAIERAKGKLRAPDDLPDRLSRAGFEFLPVTASHAWAVRAPSFGPANKDPFDRLLYAQALIERLTLATRDAELLASGLDVVEA